jgi:hypothetical protein
MVVRYAYRHTDWWKGSMKHAVEMKRGAMMFEYMTTAIKIVSGI